MFTFDSIISSVQSAQKSLVSYITDAQIRDSVSSVIDAQAQYAQTAAKAMTDIATTIGKQLNHIGAANLCAASK